MNTQASHESAEIAVKKAMTAIKGAVVAQQMILNHPGLRKTYKHVYDISDAHLYYCLVFSRATLPADVVQPEIAALKEMLQKTTAELNKLNEQMQAVASSNGVVRGHVKNEQLIETQASTPLSKTYLDLFRRADEYVVLVDSLWIEGVIDDEQHSKAGNTVCQICHKVSNKINDSFKRLLAESNKRRKGNQQSAQAAAA